MELKTPSNKGITIVELLFAIAIFGILLFLSTIYLNPVQKKQQSRDNVRISDMETLDRIINEYILDNGVYPDVSGTLRSSNVLPSGSTSLVTISGGWIPVDLSEYNSRLPIDPLNDAIYHYSFIQTSEGYEINMILEYNTDLMENDGGDDPSSYEVGNNLTIISP